ncbi:MAG: hypothetical protein GX963_08775 [Bacteroidales bacterium]|nr:hypothetical protein [Bacteroidales bacterium]
MYILMLSILTLASIGIIKIYANKFIEFMFNQKSRWYDKKIEKPRLLLHIIAFIAFLLSLIPIRYIDVEFSLSNFKNISLIISSIMLYMTALFLIAFSWTKKFKLKFIPKIEESLNRKNFKVRKDIDKKQILERYQNKNFIHETSFEDFELFIQNRPIKNKIIWQDRNTRSKQVTYITLFDMLNEIFENGLISGEVKQSVFTDFINENFIIEGVEFDKNIKGRYSEWKYSRNKAEM